MQAEKDTTKKARYSLCERGWRGLWYQDYSGSLPLGAKLIIAGACAGLLVGLGALTRACTETSYARRDQVIQQIYQQADRDGNKLLDGHERNDLFKKVERYIAQGDAGWSIDDVRKYLSVLPNQSLEKVLEEVKEGK